MKIFRLIVLGGFAFIFFIISSKEIFNVIVIKAGLVDFKSANAVKILEINEYQSTQVDYLLELPNGSTQVINVSYNILPLSKDIKADSVKVFYDVNNPSIWIADVFSYYFHTLFGFIFTLAWFVYEVLRFFDLV